MGGDDTIYGEAGNDYIEGGKDADELYGGSGDDTFWVTPDDLTEDTIDGGDGLDTLQFSDKADAPTLDITDKITNVEEIQLRNGDDILTLKDGAVLENYQKIDGGEDHDILQGTDLKVKTFETVQNFEELAVENSLTTQELLPENFATITFTGSGTSLNADSVGGDIDLTGVTVTGLNRIVGSDADDSIQLGKNTVGQISLGAGDDTFRGAGIIEDTLGKDVYFLTGSSTIDDGDGNGSVALNGVTLHGGYYNDDATQAYQLRQPNARIYTNRGVTYIYDPTAPDQSLIIDTDDERIIIKGFVKDSALPWLGISLKDDPDPEELQGAEDVLPRRDPLVLDLDGDGIETLPLSAQVQFDMDNNGFAETVGWVAADDGLLVLDQNGDGLITNGNELFGNDTVLEDGDTAVNGFTALADYDDNHDGVIDAKDSIFSQLQVWRDLNGNGFSETIELESLSDSGVAQLNLSYDTYNYSFDSNRNQHRQEGSYIDNEGNSHQLTDVWFATDPTRTTPMTEVDVPEELQPLPDAQGFGTVRSLHESMALDASGKLQALVTQFADATDPAGREELLGQILYQWVGGDDAPTPAGYAYHGNLLTKEQYTVLVAFLGVEKPIFNDTGAQILAERYAQLTDIVFYQLMSQTHLKYIYDHISFSFDESLSFLDEWQQVWIGDYQLAATLIEYWTIADPENAETLISDFMRSVHGMNLYNSVNETKIEELLSEIVLTPGQNEWAQEFLAEFKQNRIHGGDGNDILYGRNSSDTFYGEIGDDTLYGEGGDDQLYGGAGNDILNGGTGSDELYGGDGDDTLTADSGNDILYGGSGNDTLNAAGRNNLLYGNEGDDSLSGSGFLYGGSGNDHLSGGGSLYGEDGDDILSGAGALYGGDGDDFLYGGGHNDVLEGGNGNDFLDADVGNDILDGGAGDDTLYGGLGGDQYLFGIGSGHDVVQDCGSTDYTSDAVIFGQGLTPEDIDWVKIEDDLKLVIKSSGDSLTLQSGLDEKTYAYQRNYQVESFVFSDGTLWSLEDIAAWGFSVYGTAGDDTLYCSEAKDILYGGAGNDRLLYSGSKDILYGGDGNDTLTGSGCLYGEAGDDILRGSWSAFLSGGEGNDQLYGTDDKTHRGTETFDGGPGDDILKGSYGDDRYLFGIGSGHDTIEDYDYYAGNCDTIVFGEGLVYQDIEWINSVFDGDLLLVIKSTGDSLRVTEGNYNSSSIRYIECYEFADGTVLSKTDIDARGYSYLTEGTNEIDTLQGTGVRDLLYGLDGNDTLRGNDGHDDLCGGSGADILYGGNGNDLLSGGDDNDKLYGEAGNDTLDGGAGNDILEGGPGDDRYRFGLGSGQDTLKDDDSTSGNIDTVVFGEGLTSADIEWVKSGNDLKVTLNNAADTLTIQGWFDANDASRYAIERFEFADGTVWSKTEIEAAGYSYYGGSGNDTLTGGSGNDRLYGQAGTP